MAEFVEVIRQKERMCKELKNCNECGIEEKRNEHSIMYCSLFIFQYPQEAEEIIMKWAEENPVITNGDKFKEVFGDIGKLSFCHGFACPKENGVFIDCDKSHLKGFWEKEYKAPEVTHEALQF